MNLKMNTDVYIETSDAAFNGIVIGKANNSISESYIIQCTDGFIPNDAYEYSTSVIPLVFIKVKEVP